ncbi:hypothetical protein BD410DRAFT_443088 [Rickenella mellea]|uniref:F-box domain-containing protein n=1 Tax=Rickenella mellea TaxID=50990 RepID=A0A4Y7PWG6_9AGAM|nr:hypothetical protein BD410DRAFT_443088 [Rickenella mellea]
MAEWNMPLLSHFVGQRDPGRLLNNQNLSQIICLQLNYSDEYVRVRDLARTLYQMKTLQDLSITLFNCETATQIQLRPPPPHSFSIKSLKLTIAADEALNDDYYGMPSLNSALTYLSPSAVDISLENEDTHIQCLYDCKRQLFPYGSAIRLRISRECDLLEILAELVRRCDIARSVHLDGASGYFDAYSLHMCNWRDFKSLRHLRFQNCRQIFEEDVKAIASNLFLEDEDVGLQSLEFISCKNISEDFLLNLNNDVGGRLKWSF